MEIVFLHGFLLALGLILPLGVQNVFILQQGMVQKNLWRALPSIVTAAVSDTILISLAVSGVSLLMLRLAWLRLLLIAGGILFLLYMGWANWHTAGPALDDNRDETVLSAREQILFALSVSFLNPYAFLDTIGVIGTSSLQYQGGEKIVFAAAACLVSWVWFTGLSTLGHLLDRLPGKLLKPVDINRFSALFIWASAGYLSWMLWQEIG